MLYDPTVSNHVPPCFLTAKMNQKLLKCERCWSRSMSSNRKVSRSRSRQVIAWDLHSHLSFGKKSELKDCYRFFFFVTCNVSEYRLFFIILYHVAYVKSCEVMSRGSHASKCPEKLVRKQDYIVQTKKILHTQFMETKTNQNAEADTDLQKKPITLLTHSSCRFSWNRSRRMPFAQRGYDTTGTNMVALVKHSI